MDFRTLNRRMVQEQLAARGVADEKVLKAFRKVPRENFVPLISLSSAYADHPLPIGQGQTISQPYIVALMTELLKLSGKERVLEIGTGSGYQTAILAELAAEVYSIERFASLADNAQKTLEKLSYRNVHIKTDDGTTGWPQEAPFDRIIITAAAAQIPPPLLEQLKDGARLVMPLGGSFSQVLTVAVKNNDGVSFTRYCDCVFVPLVGKFS